MHVYISKRVLPLRVIALQENSQWSYTVVHSTLDPYSIFFILEEYLSDDNVLSLDQREYCLIRIRSGSACHVNVNHKVNPCFYVEPLWGCWISAASFIRQSSRPMQVYVENVFFESKIFFRAKQALKTPIWSELFVGTRLNHVCSHNVMNATRGSGA